MSVTSHFDDIRSLFVDFCLFLQSRHPAVFFYHIIWSSLSLVYFHWQEVIKRRVTLKKQSERAPSDPWRSFFLSRLVSCLLYHCINNILYCIYGTLTWVDGGTHQYSSSCRRIHHHTSGDPSTTSSPVFLEIVIGLLKSPETGMSEGEGDDATMFETNFWE